MSENQQPLDEEQAVSDVQEQETLPAAAEDTLPAAQDENAPAILDAEPEEEEEDIDPADVKIFGMKRHVFQNQRNYRHRSDCPTAPCQLPGCHRC